MVHARCVSVAAVHLTRTCMSGSLESMWWNAGVHKQGLGLHFLQKKGRDSQPCKDQVTNLSPIPLIRRSAWLNVGRQCHSPANSASAHPMSTNEKGKDKMFKPGTVLSCSQDCSYRSSLQKYWLSSDWRLRLQHNRARQLSHPNFHAGKAWKTTDPQTEQMHYFFKKTNKMNLQLNWPQRKTNTKQ